MPWWQDNFIANMYGPDFLIFYSCISLLTVLSSGSVIRVMDSTRSASAPDVPESPDPRQIAYLRGGVDELVRLTVFDLLQRGYLITNAPSLREVSSDHYVRQAYTPPSVTLLKGIDKAVYDFAVQSRRPREFLSRRLTSIVDLYAEEFRLDLGNQKLLMPMSLRRLATWVYCLGFVTIVGLGGYKFLVAMSRGRHNILFLLLTGCVATLAHMFASKPQRVSSLGRRYLLRLSRAFGRLKPSFGGPETVLAAGIYGVSAFRSRPERKKGSRGSTGQSYDSGCGSGTIHSCGSSCGGGGCGGGGCGGCGSG